jgi:hypothetical protein
MNVHIGKAELIRSKTTAVEKKICTGTLILSLLDSSCTKKAARCLQNADHDKFSSQ